MLYAVLEEKSQNALKIIQKENFQTKLIKSGYGSNALTEVARVPVDILVLDVKTGPGLSPAVLRYRLNRPNTRIILLAEGAVPGDVEVARVVQTGVYDVVTDIMKLPEALGGKPAGLEAAAKWLDPNIEHLEGNYDKEKNKFIAKLKMAMSSLNVHKKVKNQSIEANIKMEAKDNTKPSFFEFSLEMKNYNSLTTCVIVVVGAAKRVGTTSIALSMAKALSKKHEVDVIDAGGGAYEWLNGKGEVNITVRRAYPYSISPGVITIVDAGTQIPEELLPFVETTLIVTDMSRNSVFIKDLIRGNCYLVGNRCVSDIRELAEVWGLSVICEIGEDKAIKIAEANSKLPESRYLSKKLKDIIA